MTNVKQRTLGKMEQLLNHYQYLYDHTNHSKKKAKQLQKVRLMEKSIIETREHEGHFWEYLI